MKIKNIYFFILLLLLFNGCKKNEIETTCDPVIEECIELPIPSGIMQGFYQWIKQFPYYESPCFNPNNPDEVVFRVGESKDESFFHLVVYDLVTKQKNDIYEGLFFRPRWSKKDWIIFYESDFNIYKIKSDGDSLTQLTFSGQCYGPEWNISGDKFVYTSLQQSDFSIICDETGNPLDTIQEAGTVPTWMHQSLLAHSTPHGITIVNPDSTEARYIENNGGIIDVGVTTAEWLDAENIIWGNKKGIHIVNILDEEIKLLHESCDAKVYKYPTVSRISNKVIFQREDRDPTDHENNKGTSTSRIFMMNFDGSEIEEIELPQ